MLRSRLAPTPSGFLHQGNAYNFVLTWLLTRSLNGLLRLRIDDLDAPRVREEYLDDVFFTLEWLGLDWDEGPSDVAEHRAKFSQRLRLPHYQAQLQRLRQSSDQLFACRCSRKQIQAASPDGQYPGTCRDLRLDFDAPRHAWRLRTPQGLCIQWKDTGAGPQRVDLHAAMRDPVLRRKDGLPAYQIASLTDDLDHGINCIVRGIDLRDSTALQLHLADLLDENRFCQARFWHHPLLLDYAGQKLSKSAGSVSLKAWRENHADARPFYAWLSKQMGWKKPAHSAAEAMERWKERILGG